jgi:ubiquinone/menaquinone biosynthesis C-methylase UbiE
MGSQDQLVKKHFGSIAKIYGKHQDGSPSAHLFSTRLKRVNELLGDISGVSSLDVGCGPGVIANYLVSKNCNYFGADLSPEMLLECRSGSGYSEAVHLVQANIEKLPFRHASFDVVLCLGAIEYLEDANVGIQETSRVAKNNGIVVVSMQNKLSPYRLWEYNVYGCKIFNRIRKALRRPIVEGPALKIFTRRDFQNLLAHNQLKVSGLVYYDFNLWLIPLDRYFSKLAVFTSRKLEPLFQSRLRGLGTGFIVKAKKNLGGHLEKCRASTEVITNNPIKEAGVKLTLMRAISIVLTFIHFYQE